MSTPAERYLNRIVSTFCFNKVVGTGFGLDKIDNIIHDDNNFSFNAYMSEYESKCRISLDTFCPVKDFKGHSDNYIRLSLYICDKKKEYFAYEIRYSINGITTQLAKIVDYSTRHYVKLEEICRNLIEKVLCADILYRDYMDDAQYIAYRQIAGKIASDYLNHVK